MQTQGWGVLCTSAGWELVRTKPFASLPAAHVAFNPPSYLFLHVIRLALQLLDHPVELGYLALVVSQVVAELAPAAVELLQLLRGKRMTLTRPNRPFQGRWRLRGAAVTTVLPGKHPDMTSAQPRRQSRVRPEQVPSICPLGRGWCSRWMCREETSLKQHCDLPCTGFTENS